MFNVGSPYHMYMMEQEGMLDTHKSKVIKLVKEFNRLAACGYNINDGGVQASVFCECGIKYNDLTASDLEYITTHVKSY